MTAANGTGPAPQVDARQLAALRKRRFAEAGKAARALWDEAAAHRVDLEAGDVPPAAGLRKLAEKYFRLLEFLDIADQLLTPEALEALAAFGAPEPGTVTVRRDDLALLTEVARGLSPAAPGGDTPLGRLSYAAGTSPPGRLAAVPPVAGDMGDYGPWVPAQFVSACDDCGSRVEEGDSIRSDGAGGWLCASCGDG